VVFGDFHEWMSGFASVAGKLPLTAACSFSEISGLATVKSASRPAALPLHLAAVFFPIAVVGHGDGAMLKCLGDKEAVEGIAVVVGESAETVEIGRGDG
jgi:hypothetical protein